MTTCDWAERAAAEAHKLGAQMAARLALCLHYFVHGALVQKFIVPMKFDASFRAADDDIELTYNGA